LEKEILAAYLSIASAVSKHARAKAQNDDTSYRNYYPYLQPNDLVYSNDYMSTFEAVADALDRLVITRRLDISCSIFHNVSEHDINLVKANWPNGPSFLGLLQTFIALFGEFGTEYWGFETRPDTHFEPRSPELRSALVSLAALGYAEEISGSFRWTDQIRPVMEAAGFWP
jgi:hypothetical protein